MDARRLATLIRYLSYYTHQLLMLAFIDEKSDDVGTLLAQGLGHESDSPTLHSGTLSARHGRRGRGAKMYALGISGSPGLLAISKARDAPGLTEGQDALLDGGGPAITS